MHPIRTALVIFKLNIMIKRRQLTDIERKALKQGAKVEFSRWGDRVLDGRIEIDGNGNMYYINEFNFKEDKMIDEPMRYYNPFDPYDFFASFKLL